MSMGRNHDPNENRAPGWENLCNQAARDRFRRRLGGKSGNVQSGEPDMLPPTQGRMMERRGTERSDEVVSLQLPPNKRRR